jgi:hypothetical protein
MAQLAAQTTVRSDPAIERDSIDRAYFTVRRTNGQVQEFAATKMKGSPDVPLTRDELVAKYRSCLEIGMGAGRAEADRLAEVVLGLERSTDVGRDLVTAFPVARG